MATIGQELTRQYKPTLIMRGLTISEMLVEDVAVMKSLNRGDRKRVRKMIRQAERQSKLGENNEHNQKKL